MERLSDREPVHEPGQHVDFGELAALFMSHEQGDEARVAMPSQNESDRGQSQYQAGVNRAMRDRQGQKSIDHRRRQTGDLKRERSQSAGAARDEGERKAGAGGKGESKGLRRVGERRQLIADQAEVEAIQRRPEREGVVASCNFAPRRA